MIYISLFCHTSTTNASAFAPIHKFNATKYIQHGETQPQVQYE